MGVDLARFYPSRPEESRKGDFGRVVIAGGSPRYAGAPAFNALAALRAGADLAFVVAPRRAADLVAGYSPDLITIPCETAWPQPERVAEMRPDAIVVGGGVERTEAAHDAIRRIIREATCPLVLDAEALHALAAEPVDLRGKRALLTPHGGEFEVLTGQKWPADEAAREAAAREAARRYHAALIVKGRREVITDGETTHRDEAGSPFLTKGGYGDLLAGAAAAYLARGHTPLDAARAAAWLVGTAGAQAAARLGESTLASDCLARFPDVIRATP